VFITDEQSAAPSHEENRRVFARAIGRLPEALSGKTIYVAAYFPEQMVHVPQAAFIQTLLGEEPDISVPRATFDERQEFVRQVFTRAAECGHIQVLDMGALLCDEQKCRATEDGRALYFDDNHLSRYAAIKYSEVFDQAVKENEDRSAGTADRADDRSRHHSLCLPHSVP
jgi:hypothetical protein